MYFIKRLFNIILQFFKIQKLEQIHLVIISEKIMEILTSEFFKFNILNFNFKIK